MFFETRTRTKMLRFYTVAILFFIFLSTYGSAQDLVVEDVSSEGAVEDASEKNGKQTYNIIVTSSKRKKHIQDVPASITALDVSDIKDGDIDDTQDIDSYVPNMQIYDMMSTTSFYSIRGQTNSNSYSSPIGVYIDDVPAISNAFWSDMTLWGIEQIEVLRGPQGNLYGLNSSGGVINIRTRQPDNYWTADADVSYGSYNAVGGKANVSGPVVKDTLYFGASGYYRYSDSFIEEEGNDDRNQWFGGGRLQVRYTPLDRLDITLTAESSHSDLNCGYWSVEDDDPFKIDNKKYDEFNESTAHTQSLRIRYSLDSFDILSISGLAYGKLEGQNDYSTETYDYYLPYEMESRTFAEELRFVSNVEKSPFKWLVGFFYKSEKQGYDEEPVMVMSGFESVNKTSADLEQISFAVFSEISYTFFDRLTVTPGIRYDYDRKEFDLGESPYGKLDDSKDWNFISPRLAVDYKITGDFLVYTSAAKGSRAGGYALTPVNDVEKARFNQEDIVSLEVGTKTTWLGGRLMANAAGFYNSVDNMQIMVLDESNRYDYTNAGHATMYGVELELAARPVQGLEIGIPVGWMYSAIDEHETEEYENNKVPYVPDYTLGAFAQYTHRVGVFVRGEFTQLGKTYYDEANECRQGAYNVINVKVGYKGEYFSITAYCKNLFDKEYYTYKTGSTMNYLAIVGAPRTFGLQASAEY